MLWLLPLAALAALVLYMSPQTATAYVNGQPRTIVVANIGNGLVLRADAAVAFDALNAACNASLGRGLTPSGPSAAYRTSAQQAALVGALGSYGDSGDGVAAAVNHSPHQAGIAIDLLGFNPNNPADYDIELREWMLAHCHAFCWHNAGDHFSKVEPWHYEYHPELFSLEGSA